MAQMADENRYQVRIDVRIYDRMGGGGGLQISEECDVEGGTFLELAGILGQFHEVFERLKAARSG